MWLSNLHHKVSGEGTVFLMLGLSNAKAVLVHDCRSWLLRAQKLLTYEEKRASLLLCMRLRAVRVSSVRLAPTDLWLCSTPYNEGTIQLQACKLPAQSSWLFAFAWSLWCQTDHCFLSEMVSSSFANAKNLFLKERHSNPLSWWMELSAACQNCSLNCLVILSGKKNWAFVKKPMDSYLFDFSCDCSQGSAEMQANFTDNFIVPTEGSWPCLYLIRANQA